MDLNNLLTHTNFIRKKPLVLKRVISGFFKSIVLRRPVLRTVDLAVTDKCTWNCVMCSQKLVYYKKNRPVLSVGQIKELWDDCVKLGVMHVNLTGGEPLMRDIDELCQIIRNFSPHRFLVSLVTNATLMTREKLQRLKEAGLDTLQLSLEGMDPSKHDKIRGEKGSHAKIMQVIKWAKELGLLLCLSMVVTNDNFGEVRELIEYAKKINMNDTFVLLNPISRTGNARDKGELNLSEEDYRRYMDLFKCGLVRTDTVINFRGKKGCPAGLEKVHITAYGDVLTCPHVQVSYGNVLEEPIKSIWQRMRATPWLSKVSDRCKYVFDGDYIEEVLLPIRDIRDMPVSVFDHPVLGKHFGKKPGT